MSKIDPGAYKLVRLANGVYSVHSTAHAETFHPVIGPVAEAKALYVNQLRLRERYAEVNESFVIWDVGLGAAANVITVLNALADTDGDLTIASFDHTADPLLFAVQHSAELSYLSGLENLLSELAHKGEIQFQHGKVKVRWKFYPSDFPQLIHSQNGADIPKPHAIMYDAFSPAKNPAMWTLPLFERIFQILSPKRKCSLATYSRSTMLRVTLLMAGFFVGAGHASGEKEETTIAANAIDLLDEPLDAAWLRRANNSTSAQPMQEPVYRQAPLDLKTWAMLQRHPQFVQEKPSATPKCD